MDDLDIVGDNRETIAKNSKLSLLKVGLEATGETQSIWKLID